MASSPIRFASLAALLLAWLIAPAAARACDVPVFRYALERWPADALELVVFHRGPLSVDQAALMDALMRRASRELAAASDGASGRASRDGGTAGGVAASAASSSPPVNLVVRAVDLDDAASQGDDAAPDRILWQSQADAPLPWMTLTYAAGGHRHGVAWSASLARENIEALLDSPARRQIAQRLIDGHSVVWVMLDSGRADLDRAAHDRLADILKARQSQWSRSATAPADGNAAAAPAATDTAAAPTGDDAPVLPIRFSILRLAHDDPREAALRDMLRHSEDDLPADQPAVFPVFGQGRALYAIVGRGITERNVGEALDFLTGACSCEVKAQNPGVDLLIAADWSALTGPRFVETAPTELTSLSSIAEQAGTANAGADTSAAPAPPRSPATQPSATDPTASPVDSLKARMAARASVRTLPEGARVSPVPVIVGVVVFLIAVAIGVASVALHRKARRAGST